MLSFNCKAVMGIRVVVIKSSLVKPKLVFNEVVVTVVDVFVLVRVDVDVFVLVRVDVDVSVLVRVDVDVFVVVGT